MRELEAARRALAVADVVLGRELLAGAREVLDYSAALMKRSIPEHPRAPEWGRGLLDHIQKQEYPGHTTKHMPGDGPTTGYMVSKPEYAGVPYPYEEVTPGKLDDYATKIQDVVNTNPDDYMGGWAQDGLWYDDVSENDANPWSAARKADERKERAVWDHYENQEIPTDEMMAQTHWGDDSSQPGWIFSKRSP